MRTVRLGAGAGYSGDRIEPAIELARDGRLDYLVFECLAERTIALAQCARMKDAALGYDPLLEQRMQAVLAIAHAAGTRIVTNMGAANPIGAAKKVVEVARALGLSGLKVAAVVGDDVLEIVRRGDYRCEETGTPVAALGDRIVSANAYLGCAPIVAALRAGAHVVGHGPGGRSGALHGAADPRVRLGDGRLVATRPGDRRRPPPRVRGPGHRRLFRRSRLQGRSRPGAAGLPDR